MSPVGVSGVGTQGADRGVLLPGRVGSVCPGSQAAYQGALPPGASVVGAQSADLSVRQQGFRRVLGLLIP